MAQTSFNIQPCKVTASERHNKREKALDYVRPELSHLNEWCNFLDVHLVAYDAQMRKLVKEKTGRKMQEKSRALYEGIAVIRPETTMADIRKLADAMSQRFGFHFVQLAIHKDEGTWKEGVWKANLHAHMVFDKIDHETGKTIKTTAKDTAEMQDMCAAILGMERGKKSDKKHLSAIDYKVKAQEEHSKMLQAKNDFLLETGKKRLQEVADLKEQAATQTKAIALQSLLGGLAIHAAKVEQKSIEEQTHGAQIMLNHKRREIESLKQEKNKNAVEVEKTRSTLLFERGRVDYRQKQLEALKSEISGLQGIKDSLNEDIDNQIAELNDKKSEAEKAIKAKEDAEKSKDTIAAEAESLADVVQSARSDLRGLTERKEELQKEILTCTQERARVQREVANMPRSQSLVEAQKAGNIWRDMIYAIWENALAAVQVLCRYLYYPHINVTFDRDEVVALNNAMKSAQTVEDRKAYGRDLVALAHAEYPGYKDNATRLEEISIQVEKVANYSNQWFQRKEQKQDQSRGY